MVPELTFALSGEIVANPSRLNLVMLPMQDVNANDLIQLGRQFLSAAYLSVNQEADTYTLWAANPTLRDDIVPLDANNVEQEGTDDPCSAVEDEVDFDGENSQGLSKGAVGGIVAGSVAAAVLVVGLALICLRPYHCTQRTSPRIHTVNSTGSNAPADVPFTEANKASELPSDTVLLPGSGMSSPSAVSYNRIPGRLVAETDGSERYELS